MDWGKVKFFLGEVLRNFTRNAGMQATAVGTVTVTIVLLGAFLYVRAMLAHVGSDVLSQITISAYFAGDATAAQERSDEAALRADPRVREVTYVSRAQGLKELRARMHGEIDTTVLTENPLPDKLRIRVHAPEQVSLVAASLRKLNGIAFVDYGQNVVGRLLQLGAVLRRVSIAVIVLFIAVTGVIIANTIRLTVFARRREIAIMQLVGATNMFIRLPFICEGLLDGILGAALAIVLLAAGRASLLPRLEAAIPFVQANLLRVDLLSLLPQLLLVGAAVGTIASWVSVGRYLRA